MRTYEGEPFTGTETAEGSCTVDCDGKNRVYGTGMEKGSPWNGKMTTFTGQLFFAMFVATAAVFCMTSAMAKDNDDVGNEYVPYSFGGCSMEHVSGLIQAYVMLGVSLD
jgi:hypothetical protein